jgi:hypothetical protein
MADSIEWKKNNKNTKKQWEENTSLYPFLTDNAGKKGKH